jgi:hypothetical protein
VDAALPILTQHLQGEQLDVALQAARTLQLLGEPARPVLLEMNRALEKAKQPRNLAPQYLFLEFSLQAAIRKLNPTGGAIQP